jgi:galactokinase
VRLDAVACVAPSNDRMVKLISDGYDDPIVVDLSSLAAVPKERGTTAALIRGVAWGISKFVDGGSVGGERGTKLCGFSGRVASSVLPGSGLSSSAAIELLLGTIMADLAGLEVGPLEKAKIGQFAENEYFGKPCGLMDQTASAVGGIVAIDFADPAAPKVKRVAYDFAEEGYDLVVVNTGGSHADLTADYAAIPVEMKAVAAVLGASHLREIDPALFISRGPEIRKVCGDRAFLRALHFAAENERVVEMRQALEADDLGAYLKLVKKSGRSSWEQLQNIYAPSAPAEQGVSVALALSENYIGSKGAWRVHGGGFAGTIQAYVPQKRSAGYTELMERYFGAGSVIPLSVRASGALRVRL